MRTCIPLLVAVCLALISSVVDAGEVDRQAAEQALRRAVAFFRQSVSAEGSYLWRYSSDLTQREGEGRATERTAWVQPPGTPSVGDALLRAWELTGDEYYLDAATETAYALVQGQLMSGGWDYRIEFDPRLRRKYAYRVEPNKPDGRNTTTLDDDTTQAALTFLMRVDHALGFKDKRIHDCAMFALDSLLKAQYPNGAWPQRYNSFPAPDDYPVRRAGYPESWPREWPKRDYRDYYTFNDNAIADVIELMFNAAEAYDDPRYREAAEKAGGFILLAQMPEPQPAWAQQYTVDMHPAWARRFEPASVTGGESQGVLRTLLRIYERTGDRKYLEPIPRAVRYLRSSQLPDGRLARFYELKTNRPLYFTKKYELTYDDSDMPTHYGFQVGSSLDRIEREYEKLAATLKDRLELTTGFPRRSKRVRLSGSLAKRAAAAVESLDNRGAWVESGRLRTHGDGDSETDVIETRTFMANVRTLAEFVAASRE